MLDKKRVATAVIVLVILGAIVIGGAVWTITQGVRFAAYLKAVATVTSVETEEYDGEDVPVRVLVSYTAQDGQSYENASYIGDLSRCSEGMQMNVYYLKDGDRSYVYSKTSDLGFALIMLCAGAVWFVLAVVVVLCLRKSGFFYGKIYAVTNGD